MANLPPLLYRGSVKNVRGEKSEKFLVFEFSDRYSIFDWGEMPDSLDGKGKSLAIIGKSFFKYLENPKNWKNLFSSEIINKTFDQEYLSNLKETSLFKKYCEEGVPHHAIFDDEYQWESPFLKVKNVAVVKPIYQPETNNYQYQAYQKRPVDTLVPLEIIFRIGLPPSNSLSKRLGDNLEQWKQFGFNEIPPMGSLLNKPIIDFSTKLEKGDRYLNYLEAKEVASLNSLEWAELHRMTHLIALNLFNFHHKIGLELWDGKIELAFVENLHGERSFMLVDSIGIDELRLLYQQKSISKEFLREVYRDSKWFINLEKAKNEAQLNGGDFIEICISKYNSKPAPLDLEVKKRVEAVYKSYCNGVCESLNKPLGFEGEFNLENYILRYL